MDQRTVKLFIGWFVICIITTITHTFVVANVAHRMGNMPAAMAAYQKAHELDPNNQNYSEAVENKN